MKPTKLPPRPAGTPSKRPPSRAHVDGANNAPAGSLLGLPRGTATMAADELELLPVVTRQQPPPPTKGAPSPVSWPSERRSRRGGNSSPVEVRLVVHEAQKLFAADSGGTSDPFVRASAFGQTQDTKVVKEDLNPFFDELLQFKTTLGEIRSGALTLEVFDYDMLQSDDLLGGYVFDLGAVLDRPHKELYKAWVTLLDTSGGRSGPQGRVRVTLTILEDGDEMPPRPGQEVKASESDLRQYSMRVRCLRAEGLPTSKADQFITLRWAGTTVMARGKARPTPNGIDCTFEDDGLLELPVIREENPRAPPVRLRPSPSPLLCFRLTAWLITALSGGCACDRTVQTSDTVYVQLRKSDRTPGKTRTVASATLSLSDIANLQWAPSAGGPFWLNLFGSPRKDDPDLAPPPTSGMFSSDADREHLYTHFRLQINKCTYLFQAPVPPRSHPSVQCLTDFCWVVGTLPCRSVRDGDERRAPGRELLPRPNFALRHACQAREHQISAQGRAPDCAPHKPCRLPAEPSLMWSRFVTCRRLRTNGPAVDNTADMGVCEKFGGDRLRGRGGCVVGREAADAGGAVSTRPVSDP